MNSPLSSPPRSQDGRRWSRRAACAPTEPEQMAKLNLTLACGDYDLLRPLIDGAARAPGVEFNALTMASPERHGRMLRHQEFDVCELSLVAYLVARDQGAAYTAIPVFPHRRFRH